MLLYNDGFQLLRKDVNILILDDYGQLYHECGMVLALVVDSVYRRVYEWEI